MTANLHMGMNMDFDLCDTKSMIAVSGLLCLPVDPSRANINANDNEESTVAALKALFAQPVAA